jgi:1-acyl-sn-glycerol-3-phosphate acyltransferase
LSVENGDTQLDPRDQKKYYFSETAIRRFVVWSTRNIFHTIGVLKVTGAANFPTDGPVVLAANHMSIYDAFAIQFVVPRPIFYMAKSGLFRNPLMDIILRQLGGFPVQRGVGDKWALSHAQRILEHELVLGIFPEGTRTRRGGLHTAKTGAARLAIGANCPLVPLALDGTHKLFNDFPQRTSVSIKIAPPIQPVPHDNALALTDKLMFSIADMLHPELRGVYAERPPGF